MQKTPKKKNASGLRRPLTCLHLMTARQASRATQLVHNVLFKKIILSRELFIVPTRIFSQVNCGVIVLSRSSCESYPSAS